MTGQIIATSAEVTPNGGLVRSSPQNPLNSDLGIIVICPDVIGIFCHLHLGHKNQPFMGKIYLSCPMDP